MCNIFEVSKGSRRFGVSKLQNTGFEIQDLKLWESLVIFVCIPDMNSVVVNLKKKKKFN